MDISRMPQLVGVMTPFPHSIEIDAPIEEAHALMREHGVRHLPVRSGSDLVSVVSDRDLGPAVARPRTPASSQPPAARADVRVRDVCADDVYVVDLSEPLDAVLREMADRHIGSALITKHGKLAGIFTASDACRWFAAYLEARFPDAAGAGDPSDGGDDAA